MLNQYKVTCVNKIRNRNITFNMYCERIIFSRWIFYLNHDGQNFDYNMKPGYHDHNVNVQETVIIFILKFGLTISSEKVSTRNIITEKQ